MSNSLETLERKEAAPVPASKPTLVHAPTPARPTSPPPPPPPEEDDDVEPGFFARHWGKLALGALVLGGGAMFILQKPSGPSAPERKAPAPQMVRVQLPPPPPPPPKVQPPPPPEQKMTKQEPVAAEDKPAENKPKEEPKAKDEPPALGTGLKGDGPGMSGLGASGNGGGIGGPRSGGGGGPFDRYAGQVQSRIQQALGKNSKTRTASFNRLLAKVWVDGTGRITRAKLVQSSGDAAVDAAIEQEALVGQQLPEPPPAGMPMPVNMRLTARRP